MTLPAHLRLPLARRFQQNLSLIAANATVPLLRAFEHLDTYDESQVAQFAASANPTLAATKSAAVRQASGYYSLVTGIRPPPIVPDDVNTVAAVRDPFISIWQALASGNDYADAVAAGGARVGAVAANFIASSARQTGDVFVIKAHLPPPRWERIPDSGACQWCIDVSGDTFGSAEAADIGHDRCNCTISPVLL